MNFKVQNMMRYEHISSFCYFCKNFRKFMDTNFKQTDYNIGEWALINKETSEIRELKKGKITAITPTGQVRVNSKSYVFLDTERLKILRENGMTDGELGMLVLMSVNLSFVNNICMQDDNSPHTSSSISQLMGQTQQAVQRKLKRLFDLGVLVKGKLPMQKHLGTVYMLNPYFIRRGKNFSSHLSTIFNDIVKKQPPAVADAHQKELDGNKFIQ